MKKKVFIFSLIIIAIDFIIKRIVLNYVTNICIIPNFFYLTLAKNTGAAFSLLENKIIFFIIIAFIVIYYIFKYSIKEDIDKLEQVSYILLIGGIIGNLIDRVIYGYVVDYLRFIIFSYNFPIFNLADICITIGTIFLIISIFRKEKNNENRSNWK